jgi:osmoprotectant transport system substrate-binding protein
MKMPLRGAATLLLLCTLLLGACGQSTTTTPAADATAPAAEVPTTAAEAPTTAAEATTAPPTAAEAPTTAAEATVAPTTASGGATGSGATIRIGSKNFTEVLIVAELQALLLENAGFTVERKFGLGATPVAQAAITAGDIDLYGEYTSTGLQEVLKDTNKYTDEKAILDAVQKGYDQFGLTWLTPSPFNDTNTFATTKAIADQYGLKTFSDLAAKSAELRLGGPPEFQDREDTKGLYTAYGDAFKWKEYKQLDTGSLRYDALKNGDVDAVVAFSTDGRIASDGLVLLEDDKSYYPIYQLAPVVRDDVLQANPGIADALNPLAPLLTTEVMAGLNYQVDGPDKKEPADVAKAFLTEKGLIK